MISIPCERLQLPEFLIRLPSFRGCQIALKQSFLVFMLTPKVLRQWMFALVVCVCVLKKISLATAP